MSLFIPVKLKFITDTFMHGIAWHTRAHHNTTHTHSQGILFNLHQAIIQNKAHYNFLITPTCGNSQFIHQHCGANLPEKNSGNEKNTPTSISIYLFLIHFELMVISVIDELKWNLIMFAEVAYGCRHLENNAVLKLL